MHQVKSDLICEIIRNSQTNLLEKKKFATKGGSEDYEQCVTDWVCKNARHYREHYCDVLAAYSCEELSKILKELTYSQKDLEEMLGENQIASDQKIKQNPVNPESDKKHG